MMLHRPTITIDATTIVTSLLRQPQHLWNRITLHGTCALLFRVLVVCRLIGITTGSSHLHQFRTTISRDSTKAFGYISAFQDPSNCTGHVYAVVDSGFGGGFASQFQVAATEWLKVAAGYNYTVPVLIRGHLRGYSDGKECSHVHKDWTCLFLPMSSCQETLLLTGRRVDGPPASSSSSSSTSKGHVDTWVVPAEFRQRGLAWWWGVVQAYMFRLQPNVERYIAEELAHMNYSFPPPGHAVAGLHVRHGDKASDGFKHQSFEAELRALYKSPDCVSQYRPTTAAVPADSNASLSADAKSDVPMCLTRSSSSSNNNNNNNNNNSNSNNSGSSSSSSSSDLAAPGGDNATTAVTLLTPLKIFVASDDASVLGLATRMGLLADSSGVSQQTSTKGMFATMLARPDIGYNASLEIVSPNPSPFPVVILHLVELFLARHSSLTLCVHTPVLLLHHPFFRSRTSTSCLAVRRWWVSLRRKCFESP